MANEAPIAAESDIREQAAQHTLAANPLVGLRGADILDSARLLLAQMLRNPVAATQQYLTFLGELGRCQIALRQRAVGEALLPRRISEAPVLGIGASSLAPVAMRHNGGLPAQVERGPSPSARISRPRRARSSIARRLWS